MYEEVILVGNKCDYDRKSWEVDTQTGKEVKQHCFFVFNFLIGQFWKYYTATLHKSSNLPRCTLYASLCSQIGRWVFRVDVWKVEDSILLQ